MAELQQWGIMTDWRYSYFTLLPLYQSMVLRSFSSFVAKRMVTWSDRPLMWSVEMQKIMAEDEIAPAQEIREAVVMKVGIARWGEKAENIRKMYPEAKLLVFCTEPWKMIGMNSVALNEKVLYVLAKCGKDFVIVAEHRLGELQLRTGKTFKKLLAFDGDALDELVLEHPLSGKQMPVLIDNNVSSQYGTGIDGIWPAHDMRSLRVSYHYGLERGGYVDEQGLLTEEAGPVLHGLSVQDEVTNKTIVHLLEEENSFFCQYPFKNEFFQRVENGEKIILRSDKSWFIEISDRLKAQCFDALSTTQFCP